MAHIPSPELLKRLEESRQRYEELTDKLSQPEVVGNRELYVKLSKERNSIEPIVLNFVSYKKDLDEYESARKLLSEGDDEMRALAAQEVSDIEPRLNEALDQLKILLLPKDPNDDKNVLLELRAGVGGDEAGLFCADLYRAYTRFAERKRWTVEIMNLAENAAGGFKEVILSISGEKVYSELKYESGVHRVQRVPKTEAQGRVHTSTVTVAVLPEADDVELDINPTDLRIDTYRASGKGGQHVNKTDSAVRITHLPTGEVVACQDERSQLKNKNKAMKILRARLLEKMQSAQKEKEASARSAQVGGGFRNERIRTYNFPQGRVTDHRIGLTAYDLASVMDGSLQQFVDALIRHYQLEALKAEQERGLVA